MGTERREDVWSVSGQERSLAGDPEGATVHPVGVIFWSESVLVCIAEVLHCDLQHCAMSVMHL